MSLSKNRIIDILLKCIPLVYAFYIPLSLYLYVYGSLTGKIDGIYGYYIDFVKILVILLFSSFVVRTCVSEKKNPSKHFVIFAGICILEIVFSVCIHGKYHNSGMLLTIVYFIFFAAEIMAESIAISQLQENDELEGKKTWSAMNITIIIIAFCWIMFGNYKSSIIYFFMCVIMLLIPRELIRVCLVLEYAYGKKKGESSEEGELNVQQEVNHDKEEI